MPVETLTQLFSQENGSDAVALYFFYYKTAKRQQTNQIWATQKFCQTALRWGDRRYLAAKRILEQFGMIEVIKGKKINDKWYLRISYYKSKSRQNEEVQAQSNSRQNEVLHSNVSNALGIINKNALTNFTNVKLSESVPIPPLKVKCTNPNGHNHGQENSCISNLEDIQAEFGKKFTNFPAQIKAQHAIFRAGFRQKDIEITANKLDTDPFYKEEGWDMITISKKLSKGGQKYVH